MYRSSIFKKSRRGYERLGDDSASLLSDLKSPSVVIEEKGNEEVAVRMASVTKNHTWKMTDSNVVKLSTKVIKSHPLLSYFHASRRKKATTLKPEFIRYLEYVKEGGVWDPHSNRPIMYFK
ncbi:uncharacterized protein LOC131230748 [Magnolia sinica]|uniref:uncharacterized protein LOC131230748 n=1 Tax=Magnolia sinica TaxID=86752 RepID=UPI00265A6372|nr:uncharacterized protein LOC131230748 [Magnolia sinica]